MPLELAVAISIFKGDMFTPPKVWGEMRKAFRQMR
jgi:hypothetical protein